MSDEVSSEYDSDRYDERLDNLTFDYRRVSTTQNVIAFSDTFCEMFQDLASYPFFNLHLQSQFMEEFYVYSLPFAPLTFIWNITINNGIPYLYKGYVSYTLFNGIVSVIDRKLNQQIKQYHNSPFIYHPIIFSIKHIMNFVIAPIFSIVLFDRISSYSVTGIRNPFFILIGTVKLVCGNSRKNVSDPFSYMRPRQFNLWERYITYTVYYFTKRSISFVVRFIYRRRNRPLLENCNPSDDTIFQDISVSETANFELMSKFTSNLITDILMLPLWVCTNKCLLQGFDLMIDVVPTGFSKDFMYSTGATIRAPDTYFRGIFNCVRSFMDDGTILKNCLKGLGAFIIGYSIKYTVVKIFQKIMKTWEKKYA